MARGLGSAGRDVAALMPVRTGHGPGLRPIRSISNDPSGLEIRFHGVPLRTVHADDNQNALSIDFQQPVDGAMFDHLPGDVPQWISMAYANFDNGVIRSPRPVTFLTRAESDGFSLRIVPRGGAAPADGAEHGAAADARLRLWRPIRCSSSFVRRRRRKARRRPPAGFHTYADYAGLRELCGAELAVRRADPMWLTAYGRAAMQADQRPRPLQRVELVSWRRPDGERRPGRQAQLRARCRAGRRRQMTPMSAATMCGWRTAPSPTPDRSGHRRGRLRLRAGT